MAWAERQLLHRTYIEGRPRLHPSAHATVNKFEFFFSFGGPSLVTQILGAIKFLILDGND